MHVVHLTWEYPPVVYGGLGRHVYALSTAQAAAGHRVTVVTQQSPGAAEAEWMEGVRVLRVPPSGPFPYHLPSLLTWVGLLDDRIRRAACDLADVDVVHAHDWVVGRAGAATADRFGVPLVATVHATEAGRHSGWLPDDVSRAVHLIEQWLVDEADSLIVCSRAMADEVVRTHGADPARITVIPNGIDVDNYNRTERIPADLREGSPRITFVGRVEWEKGVFTAVEAMPAVVAEHPDARLRIVGTGGQSQTVRDAVGAAGLTDSVRLLGHVDEATLRAVYTSSDIAIAPSSYEPFGLVALEAAAMDVPLIVGDTGGLAEFVTDDRGRRCRPGDPADLAAEILQALADPAGTQQRRVAARACTDRLQLARDRRPDPARLRERDPGAAARPADACAGQPDRCVIRPTGTNAREPNSRRTPCR